MNEEIRYIAKKGKVAKNDWGNGDFDFLEAVYSVFKKLGQFFFHTYLLTCLTKGTLFL